MPFGGLGFGELVLIFAVLLLLFGAKRLPELASGMGRGIRDFKRAINGMDDTSIQGNQSPTAVPSAQEKSAPQVEPRKEEAAREPAEAKGEA
ncbi:MAG: twin-arginine translocase TatA/TatE family subunit [Gemmatimonadota bacterium]